MGEPELHSVQLLTVWVASSKTERRPVRDGDPSGPTVTIPRVRRRSTSGERDAFVCSVRASMTLLVDGELWRATADVHGSFASAPLTAAELRHFQDNSALYVLWPYARTFLDQLARMAGVDGLALPLIVRPASDVELRG